MSIASKYTLPACLLLSALIAGGAAALARADEASTVAAPAAANTPTEDPDEPICEDEARTGSRITRKTCLTRRERERQREQAEDGLDTLRKNHATAINPLSHGG